MGMPIVVQRDRTILLDVHHPLAREIRDRLASFAELEQSLQHIHLYRLTRLSLWNAAASGLQADSLLEGLSAHSRFGVPQEVADWIRETMARYGRVTLGRDGEDLLLQANDAELLARLSRSRTLQPFLCGRRADGTLVVRPGCRGLVKQRLRQLGYPPADLAGYLPGAPFAISLRAYTRSGRRLVLRPYQEAAAAAFLREGPHGGSGVIVLPCGAGKTLVGLAVMACLRTQTLVLCPHASAVHQWRQELLDKTTLEPEEIAEYTGEAKGIAPVTLATYQILIHRPAGDLQNREEIFPHMALFEERDWGLIIYDEVHLLPAPVFRLTAHLQARRRLGLTATLVREDGRQGDVFSLVGPKVYEAPWKELEEQGWLAQAECVEVRVTVPDALRLDHARARTKHIRSRLAAENRRKEAVVHELVRRHQGERTLIIGRYIDQLRAIANRLGAPLVSGRTSVAERERLYAAFRKGQVPVLVVSNVANYALDLPEASVAIQVSGTYGSRQEEAQRLGRILRPKPDGRPARFYSLVSQGTAEQEYAARRQRFLVEQGYRYRILSEDAFWDAVPPLPATG
ncbi:MAG: DNA repair helicase XPB [Chloroflexia bacterium]